MKKATEYLVEWPGYYEGAVPAEEVKDTYLDGEGQLWAQANDGVIFNVHPLVREAGGPSWGMELFEAPGGVYPVRWTARKYDGQYPGLVEVFK